MLDKTGQKEYKATHKAMASLDFMSRGALSF